MYQDAGVSAQPLAQLGHLSAEVAEVRADGQGAISGDIEPGGLAVCRRAPEHLGDGDRLAIAFVGEDAEDDAELGRVPQRHWSMAPVVSFRSDL